MTLQTLQCRLKGCFNKAVSKTTYEFLEKDNKEELADVLEVVDIICDFKKIDKNELESIKKKKLEERGGFKDKIILDEVKD